MLQRFQHIVRSGKALVFADQAVVSGGNFLLGVLLARYLGLEAFGLYSLYWIGIYFVLSLHQAGITKPMLTLAPGMAAVSQNLYLRRLLLLHVVLLGLLWILSFLTEKIIGSERLFAASTPLLLLAGLTGLVLVQDYLRKAFFLKEAFPKPLFLDLVLYGSLFGGVIVLQMQALLSLEAVLWLLMFSYGISSLTGAFWLWRQTSGVTGVYWQLAGVVKKHFHFSRWLLGTALLQWAAGNIFMIAAAGILGVLAVGAIRMAQNLVGLFHVLFLALENIAPVQAARHFSEGGVLALKSYLTRMSWQNGLLVISGLGCMALVAPWLIQLLYGAEYQPYSFVLRWYCLLYVFVFIGFPLRFALRTLQRTHPIFWAYVGSAGFSALAAWPLIGQWGLTGFLAGLIIGQLITLLVYFYFLNRFEQKNKIRANHTSGTW